MQGWNITLTNQQTKQQLKSVTDFYGNAYFPDLNKGSWIISEEVRDGWAPVNVVHKDDNKTWKTFFEYAPFFEPSVMEPQKRYEREPVQVLAINQFPTQPWWQLPGRPAQLFTDADTRNIFSLQVEPAPYPQKIQDPAFCQMVPIVNEQIKGSILVRKVDEKASPLPGWQISLRNRAGIQPAPPDQVTSADGTTCFKNVELGEWDVIEVLKQGWNQIGSPSNPFNLTTRLDCETLKYRGIYQEFKNQIFTPTPTPTIPPRPEIVNILVKKLDGKGNPLSGWVINLVGSGRSESKTTNANGEVCFTGLPVGSSWQITEELKPGWVQVKSPTNPVVVSDKLPCDQKKPEIFVNKLIGCVTGYKINDLEQPLQGWEISASNTVTNEEVTKITDSKGYFQFDDMEVGKWLIKENLAKMGGWSAVTPSEIAVDVQPGTPCVQVRFKNRFDTACVDVWKKDSYDGVGLPIWSVVLKPKWGGSPLTPSSTFGDGWVRFKMPAGDYEVSETPQTGWHAVGSSRFDISVQASGTCAVVTFCNLQDNMSLPLKSNCVPGVFGLATPTSTPAPTPTQSSPVFVFSSNGTCRQSYSVKSGDTFFSIATNFGLTMAQLSAANPNENPSLIYPNTTLCIP